MVRKTEYDFLTWVSFPSSIKMVCDEAAFAGALALPDHPVKGGSKITLKLKLKGENIKAPPNNSHVVFATYDGAKWVEIALQTQLELPSKLKLPRDVKRKIGLKCLSTSTKQ
jgi:hypothetical protein